MGLLFFLFDPAHRWNGREKISEPLIGRCHVSYVHEACGRQPFYSTSPFRLGPPLPDFFGHIKGAISRPAGNDQVGAQQVRTQRNEQSGASPTLVSASEKTPRGRRQRTFRFRRCSLPLTRQTSHTSFSAVMILMYLSKNFSEQVIQNIAYLSTATWSDASTTKMWEMQKNSPLLNIVHYWPNYRHDPA